IALLAMALLSLPSLAGRSKRIGFTLALARCAAICAPITPAPRTAAWRTRMRWGLAGRMAWRMAAASRRPISIVLSLISCLQGAAGDDARLALVVDRDVSKLCFGDLDRFATAHAAAALREHLHVHGDL